MPNTQSADGTRIAWYDFGGNGPAVLLAHATGFCAHVWEPVIKRLSPTLRCIAYDLRGHGQSGRPLPEGPLPEGGPLAGGFEGWQWERYAQDAAAVIAAAGLERPYGIGHSCGGATELMVEQRSPGTFQALFTFEPVIFTDDPPTGPDFNRDLAVRTRKRRTTFSSRQQAIESFSSRGPFAAISPAALGAYVDHGFHHHADGTLTLRCHPDDEAAVYVMASAHNAFSRLGEVRCPTIVSHGSRSTSFSEDHLRTVTDRLASGTFHTFDGLGHFGPLEDPERFASAVLDWVATSPG